MRVTGLARAATAVIALLASGSACSVLFGLDGYAGPGGPDGGEAGGDATLDATTDATTDAVTDGMGDGASDGAANGDCGTAPSPVAYWRLDEGEGGVTFDSTDGGNTGALVGGPVWVPDSRDTSPALRFDGVTNQYVDFGNPPDLRISGGITLSAWFNVTAFQDGGGPDMPILSKRSLGQKGWQLYLSDGALVVDVATNATTYKPALYGNGPALLPAHWYHAVAVYDPAGPSLDLYLDSAVIGTAYNDAGVPSSQYDPPNNVHLGNSAGCYVGDAGSVCPEGQLFDGIIDEVRVYAAALTPCQVQAIP